TVIAIGWHWLSPQASQTTPLESKDRQTVRPLTTTRLLIYALRPPVVAGTLFMIILSPLLIPMLREATEFSFMVRPSSDLYIFSASLIDFFVPNRLNPFFLPASLIWIGNQ